MLGRLVAATLLAVSVIPHTLQAQTSQKPIQIIVPFAPGASADGIARIIGEELSARLGRSVVVENKPGAGGTLGLMVLAKAAPDGDTLSIGASGALVINPHMPPAPNTTPFDPVRELVPVAKLIEIPLVLIANIEKGPKTVRELIERAKSTPGGISYGSTGVNSGQHLSIEILRKTTGANLVHVPYRGSAPAVTDVLGGQILLASVDLTSAWPHIQAGKVIALGVTSPARSPIAPDVPTIAEGGVPGYGRAPGFIGLFAPPGTPPAVVKKISQAVGEALATPDVQEKVKLLAVSVSYQDDATFAKFLAAESAGWKTALQGMNLSN